MSDTTIRADALAGLIVGWTGPVDYLDCEAAENGETDEPEWRPAIVNALGMVWYEAEDCSWRPVYRERPELRLDCLRPEVRARVGSVLAARGTPIHHILDAARPGALSAQHIAEAVAYCVRNVARGGEVLRGVYGPWEWCQLDYGAWCRMALVDSTCRPGYGGARSLVHDLRHDFPGTAETRAQKDIETLAANIAYIDGGALVLPTLPTARSDK